MKITVDSEGPTSYCDMFKGVVMKSASDVNAWLRGLKELCAGDQGYTKAYISLSYGEESFMIREDITDAYNCDIVSNIKATLEHLAKLERSPQGPYMTPRRLAEHREYYTRILNILSTRDENAECWEAFLSL